MMVWSTRLHSMVFFDATARVIASAVRCTCKMRQKESFSNAVPLHNLKLSPHYA